ncbi:MAG: ABC transporter ATP-binding protein [Verrucomicrobiota bacterium]
MSVTLLDEGDPPPKRKSWIFWKLIRLALDYKWSVALTFVLQVFAVILTVVVLWLTGFAIDTLRHQADPSVPAPVIPWTWLQLEDWSAVRMIQLAAVIIFAASILRMVTQIGANWILAYLTGMKIVPELRTQVFDQLQKLSFRFFDTNASSSLINRVTQDVQLVRSFIDEGMIRVMIIFITVSVYLVYMLKIHVGLTLACLATTPIMLLVSLLFSNRVRSKYLTNRTLMDGLVQLVTDSVRGIRTLKGFSLQKRVQTEFDNRNKVVLEQKNGIFNQIGAYSASMEALTNLNILVLLGYGGWLVLEGEISLGKGLVVFAGLLQNLTNQLTAITQIVNRLQESMVGATRVFEILDSPVEVHDEPNAISASNLKGHVEFEELSFRRSDGSAESVLESISFQCQPGERVAILGPTGSGKSALMNLIPRFYDATSGRLCIDGRNVRDYQLQSLRRQIGMVFQESFLFQGTISENIAFGHPKASKEHIQKAARLAGADEFIETMPGAYDAYIKEGASNLSGGQKQRIAIARVLLADPAILLLDDPTASLDPETDAAVQASLEQAMKKRTTFIVAHRISTLQHADLILVLDRGRLVQSGTHEELISQPGIYLRVARSQLQNPMAFRRGGDSS